MAREMVFDLRVLVQLADGDEQKVWAIKAMLENELDMQLDVMSTDGPRRAGVYAITVFTATEQPRSVLKQVKEALGQ